MTTTLFSAVKNEAPFLLEWVAYHKAIGFERIIVVSNDCTDNTAEVLDALSEAGEVLHIAQSVPEGITAQGAAATLVNTLGMIQNGDWCIFLDADEFLNITVGDGRIEDLVNRIGDYEGILINWKRFGDSGNVRFPGRYISKNFTRSEQPFPPETLFKTFFRKSERLTGFSPSIHRCSLLPNSVSPAEILNSAGNELSAAQYWRARRAHNYWLKMGEQPRGRLWQDEIGYDIAQINHYMVRDPASFVLKAARGRGHALNGAPNTRHTSAFYQENNCNESEDFSILRWAEAVDNRIVNIRTHKRVEETSDKAMHDYMTATSGNSLGAPREYQLTFPDTVSAYVNEQYKKAKEILEYGSGGSTVLAARLKKKIISVESSRDWAENLRTSLKEQNLNATVHYVDIGKTRAWGFPADSSGWSRYSRYPLSVWDTEEVTYPDVVLIDGRMRLACLAATALRMRRPLRVLFDDYASRKYYHVAERYFPVAERIDRMVVFDLVPGMIPAERMHEVISWFFDLR